MLSPIQKFYYLRSSLGKDPLQVIESLDVTSANYDNAWQLLTDRYENQNLMVHGHIKAIFDHPAVQKESHVELRNLFDSVSKHLRSLKSLGEEVEKWDGLIIYILSSKFDSVTRRDWEAYKYENDLPQMSDMNRFLKSRCEMLEKLDVTKVVKKFENVNFSSKSSSSVRRHTSSFVAQTNNLPKCVLCKQDHAIYNCEQLLKQSISQRINEIKRLKLCLNCLRPSHTSWQCRAKRCQKCGESHNSLLHLDGATTPEVNATRVASPAGEASRSIPVAANNNLTDISPADVTAVNANFVASRKIPSHEILLSTALVKVQYGGKHATVKVLLDSGSQSNFIKEDLCKELNLERNEINITAKGVGKGFVKINSYVNIIVASIYDDFSINLNCLVIPQITERLSKVCFDKSAIPLPNYIRLADPTFNISGDVDILLGSQAFWSLICAGQEKINNDSLILQNTRLGYVIAGNMDIPSNTSLNHCSTVDCELNEQLTKFWSIEEVCNKKDCLSEEEKYCQKYFLETVKRDETGKLIVKIPFKTSIENLGDSRQIALN
nr:unnamed protein product [Callosobruchus analis]